MSINTGAIALCNILNRSGENDNFFFNISFKRNIRYLICLKHVQLFLSPYKCKNFKICNSVKNKIVYYIHNSEVSKYILVHDSWDIKCHLTCCSEFPGERFVGMYQLQTPTLLLRDPEIIRLFLVKNFTHFTDRGFSYDGHREPLTKHLVNMEGDTWKILRQKLTPTFSSGKIKGMLGLLQCCGVQLIEYMEV